MKATPTETTIPVANNSTHRNASGLRKIEEFKTPRIKATVTRVGFFWFFWTVYMRLTAYETKWVGEGCTSI
jgi:hypothetical protein